MRFNKDEFNNNGVKNDYSNDKVGEFGNDGLKIKNLDASKIAKETDKVREFDFDPPEFDGKSTITKACRLVGKNLHKIMGDLDIISFKEGWEQYPSFDFSDICGNFKRALSTDAQENIIEFTTQNGMFTITIKVTPSSNLDSSFAQISYVKIIDTIDECTWECDLSQRSPIATFTYSGKFLANLTRLKELKYRTRNLPFMKILAAPNKAEMEVIQVEAKKRNVTAEELCETRKNAITATFK